jgi:hypothetical protein
LTPEDTLSNKETAFGGQGNASPLSSNGKDCLAAAEQKATREGRSKRWMKNLTEKPWMGEAVMAAFRAARF